MVKSKCTCEIAKPKAAVRRATLLLKYQLKYANTTKATAGLERCAVVLPLGTTGQDISYSKIIILYKTFTIGSRRFKYFISLLKTKVGISKIHFLI